MDSLFAQNQKMVAISWRAAARKAENVSPLFKLKDFLGYFPMLPKKNRILRAKFPNKQKGIRFFSPLFSLSVYKTEAVNITVSVVVSKKTAKSAVERNLIRRRIYTAVTPFIKGISSSIQMVFYPKYEVATTKTPVIKAEIEKILRHAKLLP